MTEVNKSIIEAYRSMYEPKEEVLDETNKNDKSDDGDGLDAVQPKAVKKKFDDRKDKDIDNDGDVDSSDKYLHKRRKAVSKAISKESQNGFRMAAKKAKDNGDDKFVFAGKEYEVQSVYKESFTRDDIRAMCHSKDHDCATYVKHPEFGLGKPVYESHAIPDDNGYVEWYDVEFAHGIEREVPAKDMEIIEEAHHGSGGNGDMKKDKEKVNAQKKKNGNDDEKMKDEDVDINIDNDDDDDDNSAEPEPNGKNGKKKKPMSPKKDNGEEEQEVEEPKDDGDDVEVKDKEKDKDKKKTSGNSGEKKAEISKIGEDLQKFTSFLNELSGSDAVGKKKKPKDGDEPDAEYGDQADTPEGEKDFVDAHDKKMKVAVDVDDAIKQTTKTAQDTKQGKHVKGQTAKGDKNIIKSTEAPVKDKEVKDGEGKKSVKTESYNGDKKKKDDKEKSLMDMALAALKGKTVPEMRNIIASKEPRQNPFDARTRDAKAFLERMAKRKNGNGKNGNGGQYKDKDPKDLPMIKGEKDKEKEVKSGFIPRPNKRR